MAAGERETKTRKHILNEGELRKKSSVLKRWRPRFVVLNEEMLCIFRNKDDVSKGRAAKHSLSVMDISSIENHESKKKSNCFRFSVSARSHVFCCPTELARDLWVRMIKGAQERLNEPEEDIVDASNNPTVTSKSLNPGLKEIRIERQKGQGLGCTIKSVGGVITVNRILEDGPVSTTGVLRPGDEIIEVNGIKVSGCTPGEISEIIKGSPEIVVCTIKPVSSIVIFGSNPSGKTSYMKLDFEETARLKAKKDTEERDSEPSVSKPQDFGPPPEQPPRPDRNVTYTDVYFQQAQDSSEPVSRIKQSYAYEYEDDMITAASLRNNTTSKEDNDTAQANGGVAMTTDTLPVSPVKRDNSGPEYENVYVGSSGQRNSLPLIKSSATEEIGLNYADLDFSSTADNEEHLYVKKSVTRQRSNSLPVKSTKPELKGSDLSHDQDGNLPKSCDPQDESQSGCGSPQDSRVADKPLPSENKYPEVKYPYIELDFSKKEQDGEMHTDDIQGLLA